jgi:hypothetical protein
MTTVQRQYVPFYSGQFQPRLLRFGRSETVIRLVLDNLPIPKSNVEWSQILEFRADPASRMQLAQLRSWVADMAAGSFTAAHIQDKLEFALMEYQQHIEYHKMKYDRGLLEIIVVATAEVLEELAHGKFSKLASKLFQVFREEASLLEAERSAPGRAVAYIQTAESRFSI